MTLECMLKDRMSLTPSYEKSKELQSSERRPESLTEQIKGNNDHCDHYSSLALDHLLRLVKIKTNSQSSRCFCIDVLCYYFSTVRFMDQS